MKLGIIGGGGYWGEKWVRNLKNLNVLGGICEIDDSNSQMIISKYALTPNEVIINRDIDLFLENRFDGIVIATPPLTHFEIARKALRKNHNILVEKPMVIDTSDALNLESMMNDSGNILMTGHTFVYHPAVRALKEALFSLGDVQKLNIVRANWGKFQNIGIIYDLFPHDLSIANYLLGSFPRSLNGHVDPQEDFAFLTYEINNINCSSYLSWCSSKKERRIEIVGSLGTAFWSLDDETITVCNFHENSDKNDLFIKSNNIKKISYSKKEALTEEAEHFLNCIKYKTKPLTNIDHGIQITNLVHEFQELANTHSQAQLQFTQINT